MLVFNLKKEWFEKIKSGEKTHEYRRQTLYWTKRLSRLFNSAPIGIKQEFIESSDPSEYSTAVFNFKGNFPICFCCGYPAANDKEKRIYANLKRIIPNVWGKDTDLKIDEPVFDIQFELI